jgi:hypothetical protein
MPHSYEEIRAATLDILAGREMPKISPNHYEHLMLGVGEVFAQREGRIDPRHQGASYSLEGVDRDTFLELFWDLFRQGIISLGRDDNSREFPFYRVTRLGTQIAAGNSRYFFHDVSSYEAAIRSEVPNIHDVTLLYLKEAMQAFRSGCILSATVMLGVATEHTFLLLIEKIENSSTHRNAYAVVSKEKTILQKINKFKHILDQQVKSLPLEIKEDLDTHFAGILSVIRNFRNQSGHPTGKLIDREQAFVLLQLFIPYSKKLYQLMGYFK